MYVWEHIKQHPGKFLDKIGWFVAFSQNIKKFLQGSYMFNTDISESLDNTLLSFVDVRCQSPQLDYHYLYLLVYLLFQD
jgi:hypothetical protein